jgi:hypothetical protein
VRVLFLDIDGVLNRDGFQPDDNLELASWIEPELAARLTAVLARTQAAVVLSSDWRLDRELAQLRAELAASGIGAALIGLTPALDGQPRWREIEAWMVAHQLDRDAVVIVDDLHDMGKLASRFVRTDPTVGLDDRAAAAVVALFGGEGD